MVAVLVAVVVAVLVTVLEAVLAAVKAAVLVELEGGAVRHHEAMGVVLSAIAPQAAFHTLTVERM